MLHIKNIDVEEGIYITVKFNKSVLRLLLMCSAIYITYGEESIYETKALIRDITSLFKDNTDTILNETKLKVIYQWLSISYEFITQEDKNEAEEIKTQLFNILYK